LALRKYPGKLIPTWYFGTASIYHSWPTILREQHTLEDITQARLKVASTMMVHLQRHSLCSEQALMSVKQPLWQVSVEFSIMRTGIRVAPFKAQNMSNNATPALLPDGSGWGEIGTAQALQAEVCGLIPRVEVRIHALTIACCLFTV
jgi:hypothetical protein